VPVIPFRAVQAQEAAQQVGRVRVEVEYRTLTAQVEHEDLPGVNKTLNKLLDSPHLPPSAREPLRALKGKLNDQDTMAQLRKVLHEGNPLPTGIEPGLLPSSVRPAFNQARNMETIESVLNGNVKASEELETHLILLKEVLSPQDVLLIRFRLAERAASEGNNPLARKLIPREFPVSPEDGQFLRDVTIAKDNVETVLQIQRSDLGLLMPLAPAGARPAQAGSAQAGLPPLQSAKGKVQTTLKQEVDRLWNSRWSDIRKGLNDASSHHLSHLPHPEWDRERERQQSPSPLLLTVERKLGRALTGAETVMVSQLHRQGHNPDQIVKILKNPN